MGGKNSTGGAANRSELIRRFGINERHLSPQHDYTFGENNKVQYKRGNRRYYPPWNYKKLGVQLADSSFMNADNGWVVAYHGTFPDAVPEIIHRRGFEGERWQTAPEKWEFVR